MLASSVVSNYRFKSAWNIALQTLKFLAAKSLVFGSIGGICMLLLWSRFVRGLKTEIKKEGSAIVLTAKEVKQKLKIHGQSSI